MSATHLSNSSFFSLEYLYMSILVEVDGESERVKEDVKKEEFSNKSYLNNH